MSNVLAHTEMTAKTRSAWDTIAAGYDEFVTATHHWTGNEALERAGGGSGKRFLDGAVGSGGLSVPAARRGAEVVSIELSPVMIECLRARARAEGLTLEGHIMDGTSSSCRTTASTSPAHSSGSCSFPICREPSPSSFA